MCSSERPLEIFRKFGRGKEKRPVYNRDIEKKMSELVQGQLLGINVIGDSGNGVGTLCFRERYSPQQLPTSAAGTHHLKALDWKEMGC